MTGWGKLSGDSIHPGGEFAYTAEELSSTVMVFSVGTMLPEDYDGNNSAVDIHLSPDGRFLYASNRGHNSLVICRVDTETGTLWLMAINQQEAAILRIL